MLRQPFVECGCLAAAFESAARLSSSREPLYSCVVPIAATTVGIFVFISQNFLGHLHLICPSAQLCSANPAGIVCRDRHPTNVSPRNSVLLSRHAKHRCPVIPVLSMACALFFSLAPLFCIPILCFQSLADSFCKTPGYGGVSALAIHESPVTNHGSQLCAPFVFMVLQIVFPTSSFLSQSSALPPGCHPPQHLLPILEDAKMKHRPNQ